MLWLMLLLHLSVPGSLSTAEPQKLSQQLVPLAIFQNEAEISEKIQNWFSTMQREKIFVIRTCHHKNNNLIKGVMFL